MKDIAILLNTAKGDAYGAGFEYASREHVRRYNTMTGFVKNEHHSLRPSVYTDDTQMSVANAEVIVSGVRVTRGVLADSYVGCFKRDPREGYASGFHSLLSVVGSGAELLDRLGDARSDKSGGCMRAVVWGLYPTIDEVKRLAALQAAITHNTADGVHAAVAAALMGHYFLYKLGRKRDLGTFLEEMVTGAHRNWSSPWRGSVGAKGWQSVHAAVSAIMKHESLSRILHACVEYTGDVDTVAAIALGAASACDEIDDDLPDWLHDDLENGEYGRDYLISLDRKLSRTMTLLWQESEEPHAGAN